MAAAIAPEAEVLSRKATRISDEFREDRRANVSAVSTSLTLVRMTA